jgi:hypothetical protein
MGWNRPPTFGASILKIGELTQIPGNMSLSERSHAAPHATHHLRKRPSTAPNPASRANQILARDKWRNQTACLKKGRIAKQWKQSHDDRPQADQNY